MPKDNIERAIAKGTGADSDAESFEEVLYEGYGPGGVAILVETLTDNRNRTGSEVRHTFTKHGGNLGEPGSVAWTFEKKGEIVVDGSRYAEDDLLAAIDAGAEDVVARRRRLGDRHRAHRRRRGPRRARGGGRRDRVAELVQRPTTRTPVEEDRVATLMRLIDALEESDDVQAVHANFDVDSDVLERVAAGLDAGALTPGPDRDGALLDRRGGLPLRDPAPVRGDRAAAARRAGARSRRGERRGGDRGRHRRAARRDAPAGALVAARNARRRLPGEHPHGGQLEAVPRIPAPLLWARLPVQFLFALMTWRGTR